MVEWTLVLKAALKFQNQQWIRIYTKAGTKFANDISEHAKIAWNDYFSKRRGHDLNGTSRVGSVAPEMGSC